MVDSIRNIHIGGRVSYTSISGAIYDAEIAAIGANNTVDLRVLIDGKVAMELSRVPYEPTGRARFSWAPV